MNNSITAEAELNPGAHSPRLIGRLPIPAVGDWLRKAAAPTFAAMALFSALSEHSAPTVCAALGHAGPFGGMTAMYLLMAFFHLSAWLPRGTAAGLQSTPRSQS